MKIFRRFLRIVLVLFILLNAVAAMHAWKFSHFYDEPGKQRKRADDMTAIEKAKGLFLGVNWPKSVNNTTPSLKFQTVYFRSTDKIQLQGWFIKRASAKGTVILFHGYGGSKSAIIAESEWFYEQGYSTLLVDLRAHGGSTGNTCTIGYSEADDVEAAYEYVKTRGEKKILLWGTSLGAASIMHAMDKFKLQPSRVVLEMPFASLHDAVKARVRVMGLPAEPVASLLTFWGGVELGFWAFNHEPSVYARSVKCPVLLQWGIHDNRVSAVETETIFANLASKQKKLVVYRNSAHQSFLQKEPLKWDLEMRKFLE